MRLYFIDFAVIAAYILILLFIGFVSSLKKKGGSSSDEDYLLAGRKVTLPFFVATLVATWYGNILGVGEFVYRGGIVAWISFGLPYYISAALFAFFIAKKIRNSNVKSIPEQIANKFGQKAGWLSSIIILLITLPAAYFLMIGILIQIFFGWSLLISIIIGALFSLVFIYSGGLKSDIYLNAFQFILMYLGFAALIYFTLSSFGGITAMAANLPTSHLKLSGTYSLQYIVVWYILALQTFVDPSFHQRSAAAITPGTAKKGILISILCWALFDSLTLLSGLYAKAYIQIDSPLMAFPALGDKVLPIFWKGFFVVSMLSVIMSTLQSYSFISAATIGNDILAPLQRKFGLKKGFSVKALTKFGFIISSVLAVILAYTIPSAIDLIYKTASVAVPGLLAPLLLSYFKRWTMNSQATIAVMLLSSAVSFFWIIISYMPLLNKYLNLQWMSGIEPMFPGIVISFLLTVFLIKKDVENI